MKNGKWREAETLLQKIVDDFNKGLELPAPDRDRDLAAWMRKYLQKASGGAGIAELGECLENIAKAIDYEDYDSPYEDVEMSYAEKDVSRLTSYFTGYFERLKQRDGDEDSIEAAEREAKDYVREFDGKVHADTLMRGRMYELVETAAEAARQMKQGEIQRGEYASGSEFWADIAGRHGKELGLKIGGDYLSAQLKSSDQSERGFCRELFAAMQETLGFVHERRIYPHSLAEARNRGEIEQFKASRERDIECAKAITAAIRDCCYERDHYNISGAVLKVLNEFGFERVSGIMAAYIQAHDYDGRFSGASKTWARETPATPENLDAPGLLGQSHSVLLDAFADELRKTQIEFGDELLMPRESPEQSQGMSMGGI
jgi:hypothetical protein